MATTASSKAALAHLKKLKPSDGWSVERNRTTGGVRLLRRNAPLTDNWFLDIHHDATATSGGGGAVVGILAKPSHSNKAYAQVLVDETGRPASSRRRQTVSVTGWRSSTTTTTGTRSAAANNNSNSSTTTVPDTTVLTDEQNLQLVRYGAMVVGGLIVLRWMAHAAVILYVLALPVLYVYGVQTCPADDSFDAKRELKRVMRGHHLPDDHPDKPRGFLSETLARLQATVTAEVATGFMGYEVTMINLAGAAKVASVRVPAAKMDYFWVGVVGRWFYVYCMELEGGAGDAS